MDIASFNVVYEKHDDQQDCSISGITFRGAFGNAFRSVVCAFKTKECKNCLLKNNCIYIYVFDTIVPEDSKIMRKYEHIPHPFVIELPDSDFNKGSELNFGMVLIGDKAIGYLPYFIYAFEIMAKKGFGRKRVKLELKGVMQGSKTIYDGELRPSCPDNNGGYDL